MGGILDKLDEWLRGLLTESILGNLSGMFDTVNTKVGEIAGEGVLRLMTALLALH